jgi:hypothetical protein
LHCPANEVEVNPQKDTVTTKKAQSKHKTYVTEQIIPSHEPLHLMDFRVYVPFARRATSKREATKTLDKRTNKDDNLRRGLTITVCLFSGEGSGPLSPEHYLQQCTTGAGAKASIRTEHHTQAHTYRSI